jgi:hypothetical protein
MNHPLGALNWTNGETVAVKQIQLANIPKAEIAEMMVCAWHYPRGCFDPTALRRVKLICSRTSM